MKLKQNSLILVLAIVAGFVGGFISNQIFTTKSAFAEKETKPQKLIIAEQFRLVDNNGKTIGSWTSARDLDGRPQTSFSFFSGKSLIALIAGQSISAINVARSNSGVSIHAFEDSALINLTHKGPKGVSLEEIDRIEMSTSPEETYIHLRDKKGNRRVNIGNVSLVKTKTGVTGKHTVSSILLFDEKGKVLWSAP